MFSLLTLLESAISADMIHDLALFFAMPNHTIKPSTIRGLQVASPVKNDKILYRVLFAETEELDDLLDRCSFDSTLVGTRGEHTSQRCTSWSNNIDATMNVIQDYSESSDFEYAVIVKAKIKAADMAFDSTDATSLVLRDLVRESPALKRNLSRQREVIVCPGTYGIQIVEVISD